MFYINYFSILFYSQQRHLHRIFNKRIYKINTDIKCILFSSITDVNIVQIFVLVFMKDGYDKLMKIN